MCRQRLRLCVILSAALLIVRFDPVHGQRACGDALPSHIAPGIHARVTFTDGRPLNVRAAAGVDAERVGQLAEGAGFVVAEGSVCVDGMLWWRIEEDGVRGWVAEGSAAAYFIEPAAPETEADPFANADWGALIPDLPPVYRGDLPALPLNLNAVRFITDAGLIGAQKALLRQNGFVVVPGEMAQFYEAYMEGPNWNTVPPDFNWAEETLSGEIGHAFFITTDSMLHALHYIFSNLLADLERQSFRETAQAVIEAALPEADAQAQMLRGTALAGPARTAGLYLAVALELFAPGRTAGMVPADIAAEAARIAELAQAGQGQSEVPFLDDYTEDWGQYRPRGHYADDAELQQYFRGMMWLGRITFRAESEAETQTALLLLNALQNAQPVDGASCSQPYAAWRQFSQTLAFLFGPVDDLGPPEYAQVAEQVFGSDADPLRFADAERLAAFRGEIARLPAPRVNGLVLAAETNADEIAGLTRGFRLLGQRFTLDGYVMQQLMYPYVGTRENPRALPLGLDVAAALGSDVAYGLAAEAGATSFVNYDTQVGSLRGEVSDLTAEQWLENIYGGWLWALEPLWVRDAEPYPPMMATEAWLRRDLQAGLASWTELKHDAVLYIKQPTGFGGGGVPLSSFGYVEPNPLVFGRVAAVSRILHDGLQNGLLTTRCAADADAGEAAAATFEIDGVERSMSELERLSVRSARLADMARRELAGEPLVEDDYWLIIDHDLYLFTLLFALYQGDEQPDPVALVADVASNPTIGAALQEAVGSVDTIYVAVPAPTGGYQLVRGGVFSYYEWVGDINARMTDDEWRSLLAQGETPPRPAWTDAFYAE